MATPDFKPAQKAHVYDLLGRLNASFARTTRNLYKLECIGIFEIYTMRKLYHLTKELQANANYHLLETPARLRRARLGALWQSGTRKKRIAVNQANQNPPNGGFFIGGENAAYRNGFSRPNSGNCKERIDFSHHALLEVGRRNGLFTISIHEKDGDGRSNGEQPDAT